MTPASHRPRTAPTCSALAATTSLARSSARETANLAAVSRPGRYQTLEDGLEVKEVWVGEGAERRRFVVARNRAE